MLVLANPAPGSGLFVWATRRSLAVLADPDTDTLLDPIGELTVCSGRLVVGGPEVVTAWGSDVDTGDGSTVRGMHRGRTRLGLIVVTHSPDGQAEVGVGAGAAAATFPQTSPEWVAVPLALAGCPVGGLTVRWWWRLRRRRPVGWRPAGCF
jgi:hypothetical protein